MLKYEGGILVETKARLANEHHHGRSLFARKQCLIKTRRNEVDDLISLQRIFKFEMTSSQEESGGEGAKSRLFYTCQ